MLSGGYQVPPDRHEMPAARNQVQHGWRSDALPAGGDAVPSDGDTLPAEGDEVSAFADEVPAPGNPVREQRDRVPA